MLFSKIRASRVALLPLLIMTASLAACQTIDEKNLLIPTVEERVLLGDIHAKGFHETRTSAQQIVYEPGDVVDIEVFNEPNISGFYPVDNFGNATFPYIGSIKVSGMNTIEVQNKINQQYSNGFYQRPNIVVKELQKNAGYVVVDGEVEKPGIVDLTEITHLSEVIAKVGGLSEYGDPESVYVLRDTEGEKELYRVNITNVRLAQAKDPVLLPSDIIIVKKEDAKFGYEDILRALPLINTFTLAVTRF